VKIDKMTIGGIGEVEVVSASLGPPVEEEAPQCCPVCLSHIADQGGVGACDCGPIWIEDCESNREFCDCMGAKILKVSVPCAEVGND